jgi:hypothetical protein
MPKFPSGEFIFIFQGEYTMRRSRLPARVAVKGATLFALCAGAPVLVVPVLIVPGARADAGGHHRDETSGERRAGSAGSSVTLRVLPAVTTPATEPAGPSSNGAGTAGPAADAHSDGVNDISSDLHGGHTISSHNGNASTSHGRHSGRHAITGRPARGPSARGGAAAGRGASCPSRGTTWGSPR